MWEIERKIEFRRFGRMKYVCDVCGWVYDEETSFFSEVNE